jgi:hypothetical protein
MGRKDEMSYPEAISIALNLSGLLLTAIELQAVIASEPVNDGEEADATHL